MMHTNTEATVRTEQDIQALLDWTNQLAEQLQESATEFDFFQAIRRVESLTTDLPRVGYADRASDEAVRIAQTPALDFAPSTIDRIDHHNDGRARVSQRFFGLLGPAGPLPLQMTQDVRDQHRHDGDSSHESFLNLFHHRMATLFYRAWADSRGAIQRDRPDDDRFAAQLSAVSGSMPTSQRSGEKAAPSREPACIRETRLFLSGRFASSHRNAEGLQAVVSELISAPVQVQTFVLRQLRLQPEDRTVLTTCPSRDGRGGMLGQSIVLGRTVADRRSLVTVRIGPLTHLVFRRLLPGGYLHEQLRSLVRGYVDPGIDCQVQLVLDQRAIPRMSLGREADLGRSTWLNSRPPRIPAGDCQFQL